MILDFSTGQCNIQYVLTDGLEQPKQYVIFGCEDANGKVVAEWNGDDFTALDALIKSGDIPVRPSPISHLHTVWDGENWSVDTDTAWGVVSAKRDDILQSTQFRVAEDEPDRDAWLAYRASVRAVMEQTDPLNIVWPEPPNQ